eukprot:COSAG01_NODE_8181_length_2887_cov_91.439383_4_plen_70_part_00
MLHALMNSCSFAALHGWALVGLWLGLATVVLQLYMYSECLVQLYLTVWYGVLVFEYSCTGTAVVRTGTT